MNDLDDDLPEKPSKTQRKRDMEALQALGESLIAIAPAKLASLHLPPELIKALTEAKKLNMRKAGRRHFQYIGKLMRDLNEDEIAAIHHFLAMRRSGR